MIKQTHVNMHRKNGFIKSNWSAHGDFLTGCELFYCKTICW